MNIGDKLIVLSTVICVFVVYCPFQNNGEVSLNQLNLRDAIRDITNHSKIKSYVSESYYSLTNKAIENIALRAIKKQKTKLKEEEPFVYDFTKAFNFSGAQFTGQGTIQNVTLPDASQFVVTNLTSYKQENELDFEIFFKEFTANDMNYNVQGKALTNIPINGRGKINATISNVTVQGKLRYDFSNGIYQIEKILLHYKFDSFELTITGLNVPLLSSASLNRLLSREVTNYLRKNEKKICAEVSKTISKQLNKKLKNFSFFDFMKSLWATLSLLKTANYKFAELHRD